MGDLSVKISDEYVRIVREGAGGRPFYKGRPYQVGVTKRGSVAMVIEDEQTHPLVRVVRSITAVCACDDDARPDKARFATVDNLKAYKRHAHDQPVFWLRLQVLRMTVALGDAERADGPATVTTKVATKVATKVNAPAPPSAPPTTATKAPALTPTPASCDTLRVLRVTPSLAQKPYKALPYLQTPLEHAAYMATLHGGDGLVDATACSAPHDARRTIFNQRPGRCDPGDPRHGLLLAAYAAFADELPFALRAQHLHMLVLQGVAMHVANTPRHERPCMTSVAPGSAHDRITIEVKRDDFCVDGPNDWASVVHGMGKGDTSSFASQLRQHLRPEVSAAASMDVFSDTTPAETIASTVALMHMCEERFCYKVKTRCGHPWVGLEGPARNWEQLPASIDRLLALCAPAFAREWGAALHSVVDKILHEVQEHDRQGDAFAPDERFWNAMCKRGGQRGSGGYSWLNGWINALFPYVNANCDAKEDRNRVTRNPYCVPWSPDAAYAAESLRGRDRYYDEGRVPDGVRGPRFNHFPNGLSSVRVDWVLCTTAAAEGGAADEEEGRAHALQFFCGFVATQDPETRCVRPRIHWWVAKQKEGGEDEEDDD
jgi:hypothetical protein